MPNATRSSSNAPLAAARPEAGRDQILVVAIEATPSIQSLLDAHAERRPTAVALACSSVEDGWIHAS
jgi:hypothetical protein